MFEADAKEVFEKAGVEPKNAPEFFEDVKNILSEKMATLSITMGMSMKRVEAYDAQKESLVEDLNKLKNSNNLR